MSGFVTRAFPMLWIASSVFFGFQTAPLYAEEIPYMAPSSTAAAVLSVSSAPVVTLSTEPFVSPLGKGKLKIVSGFGKRPVPGGDAAKMEHHDGLDLAILPGAPIRAARSGKVLFAGFSKAYASRADKTDQNHLVIVRHADGMSTRYVHLDSLKIRPMQEVVVGQVLGTASESDEWTGPVLHFEIRTANGRPVNPKPLLQETKP